MGARAKAKTSTGARNDRRPNGKAWKNGKSPEVRAEDAREKAGEKRVRKAVLAATAHLVPGKEKRLNEAMDASNKATDDLLNAIERTSPTN